MTLTLQELFVYAPAACRATRESGLIATDRCRKPVPGGDDAPAWTVERDETPRSYLDPVPTDEPTSTTARVTTDAGRRRQVGGDEGDLHAQRHIGIGRGHLRQPG